MAVYRAIYTSFWEDAKVVDDMTPEDRYFYFYLMTNTHTNLLGCYELGIKGMSSESGYQVDVVEKLLARLEKDLKVIKYSTKTKEVLLLNWHKYNWGKSDKTLKGIQNLLLEVKNKEYVKYIQDVSIPYVWGIQGGYEGEELPIDNPPISENREQRTETVKEKEIIVQSFFEEMWKLYPLKKGKEAVSKKSKKEIEKSGYDVIKNCIDVYIRGKPDYQDFMNGSTFFNGRWREFINVEAEIIDNGSEWKDYEENNGYDVKRS